MVSSLRKEYLVSYDIEITKVRTRLFKELSRIGLKPVQKSVFWGYLTNAELLAIKRFVEQIYVKNDKVFITHTNFNSRGNSFLIGYEESEFRDWNESEVI